MEDWDDGIYYEDQYEGLSEDTEETLVEDGMEASASDQSDLEERIDDLLDKIESGQTYGSMGDYFVPGIGCYAFPCEDCFYYFISEEERSGWTAASNGCYVPAWSIEAYESYLFSGILKEEMEGQGEEQLSPAVSQEDLAGLESTLQEIYDQDGCFYEAVIMNSQQIDQNFKEIKTQLTVISIVLVVLCVFLAILCGKGFADTFFERMRAG